MFFSRLHEDVPTLSCGADHYDMHTSTRLIGDDTFYLPPVCLKYPALYHFVSGKERNITEQHIGGKQNSGLDLVNIKIVSIPRHKLFFFYSMLPQRIVDQYIPK